MADQKNLLLKNGIKYLCFFFLSIALLTGFLTVSALLPGDRIRENMHRSAELVCEKDVFFNAIENIPASKIDRYADSIILNIAWNFDPADPLASVMESKFYDVYGTDKNQNLMDCLDNGYAPNLQYIRYWHGSAAVVRFLMLFTDLKGIYILNALIMAVLTAALLITLLKRKLFAPAVGFISALISVSVWFVPFSMEYTWNFILMLVFSLAAVRLELKGTAVPGYLFLAAGILTNYLDFLTTETLTLLMPLILVLYLRLIVSGRPLKEGKILLITSSLFWGAGYCLTWVTKWALAALVLHKNTLPLVTGYVDKWLGETTGLSPLALLAAAVTRNLTSLFPFGYDAGGVVFGVILLITLCYIFYVHGKKTDKKGALLLLLIAGLLPYVRYLVLRSHSYGHFFFTYRAQAS
ncbi:MAG: hypothetical protein IKR68_10050, partial [Lachnospiraceae bacterium]|nr:hypothetical protein [Lachnospiraceae bacterium]